MKEQLNLRVFNLSNTTDMRKNENIFNDSWKASMSVPEGYFNGLRERLCEIPEASGQNVRPIQRMTPYLALAACFVAILLVGNFVLGSTTGNGTTVDFMNEAIYADLMAIPDEALQTVTYEQDTISYADVIDYLIASGASSEIFEYTNLVAKK